MKREFSNCVVFGSWDTTTNSQKVYLAGKHVGNIFEGDTYYQYFPKGQKAGGDTFETLAACQESL